MNACVSSSYTWPSVKPVYSTSSVAHVGKKVSAEAPFLFPLPGYGQVRVRGSLALALALTLT